MDPSVDACAPPHGIGILRRKIKTEQAMDPTVDAYPVD